MRRSITVGCGAWLLLLATMLPAAPACALDRVLILQEFITDRNSPPGRPDGYMDTTFFAARGPVHAALNLGTFARGLEAGWTGRDRRGGSYVGLLRRRQGGFIDDTALEARTSQAFGRWVAKGSVRLQWPDRPDGDNLLLIPEVGAEVYTSSYSFAAVRAILDPRPYAGVAFLLTNRLATRDAFFEFTLVPRTDGTLNYAVRGRWRWVHLGYARDHDFDYSRISRDVWMLGLQYDFGP
ncbi:MAG: hypothetical protein JSW67_10425 [Candidatus Latescibacterota bacterium]|nr:MAG: hypothetical protein JSW67_10425 [Candidatus Latescibacterota bacterium]